MYTAEKFLHQLPFLRFVRLFVLICGISLLVLLSIGIPSVAGIEVTINSSETPAAIDAGGDLDVAIELTNTNTESTTQTIQLERADGTIEDSVEIQLDGSAEETIMLTWSAVPDNVRSVEPVVQSETHADATAVTVLWSEIEIADVELNATEIPPGEVVPLNVTVTNVGTEQATQSIDVTVNGTTESEAITLDEAEEAHIHFDDIGSELDTGTYTIEIDTTDDTDEATLTVLQNATYSIDIIDTSLSDGSVQVATETTNIGDLPGDPTISIEFDDKVMVTETVQIGGGDSKTNTFDLSASAFPINVTARVASDGVDSTQITQPAIEHGPSLERVYPDTVDPDEAITIEYTAEGTHVDEVEVIIENSAGESVFSETIQQGIETEHTISVPDLASDAEDEYTVILATSDQFGGVERATKTDAFSITSLIDSGIADIDQEVYESPAGDFVEISVELNELDEAYLLIGGDAIPGSTGLQNYFDILYLEGDTSFIINTRLVGTDRPTEDVYMTTDGSLSSYAHGESDGANTDVADTSEFQDVRFVTPGGSTVATSLAEFRDEIGITGLPRPLQPSRYRLVAGADPTIELHDDGVPRPRQAVARSNLILAKPSLEGIEQATLPAASANKVTFTDEEPMGIDNLGHLLGEGTDRETIVLGDRILLTVDATGMYGALLDGARASTVLFSDDEPDGIHPDELNTLLTRPEGISLTITQTNPGKNQDPIEFSLDNANEGDVFLIPETTVADDPPTIERFHLVIDTRGIAPFTRELEGGEEFRIEFSYESPDGEQYRFPQTDSGQKSPPFNPDGSPTTGGIEHFPYFDSADTSTSVVTAIEFEAPAITYEQTTRDGDVLAVAQDGETIAGNTNFLPETPVSIQIVAEEDQDAPIITLEHIDIAADGSFSISPDLSGLGPDDALRIEFYRNEQMFDSRELIVVEDESDFTYFSVDALEAHSIIEEGVRKARVFAEIANTGYKNGTTDVEFIVDGEIQAVETHEMTVGSKRDVGFGSSIARLEPGEYTITVRTADEEVSQQLLVPERFSFFEISTFTVESPVSENEQLTASATIENQGNIPETSQVELDIDGDQIFSDSVELDPGDSTNISIEEPAPVLEQGEFTITLRTSDDEVHESAVYEADRSQLDIISTMFLDSYTASEHATARVYIQNTGLDPAEDTITITIETDLIRDSVLTLEPGDTHVFNISDDISTLEPGNYTVLIETPNDSRQVQIHIAEPHEPADPEPYLLGHIFPIDPRRLVGGTLLVGVIYTVGHWV